MNVVGIDRDLSFDIMIDILSRLRARDLLRFRCVSKSWKSLIDSSYFIDIHHNQSVHTCSGKDLFFSHIDHYTYRLNDSNIISESVMGDKRFFLGKYSKIIGFAKGLYLLQVYTSNEIGYVILNTSTKEYRELPDVPIAPIKHPGFGFCYDSINEDYKVVLFYENFDYMFVIYSLKVNSWRRIKGKPFISRSAPTTKGLLLNNALHWQSSPAKKITAFDIRTEERRIFSLPDDSETVYPYTIEKLEERLSIVRYDYENHNTACLWMMMDYGVDESWTKLLSISSPLEILPVWPLCYSKDRNEILFLQDIDRRRSILSYDLSKQTAKVISVYAAIMVAYACVSIENLVKLSSYGKKMKKI